MFHHRLSWALTCVALAALTSEVRAEVKAFVVNPSLSSLSVTTSTTTTAGGPSVLSTAQGLGSLSTSYSGLIFADVTSSSIQFLAPTRLIAANSGSWKPGDDYSNYPADYFSPTGYRNTPAPASYGVTTDLTIFNPAIGVSNSAIRDLEIGLSDTTPKPIVAGEFNESGLATDFLSGTVFYDVGAAPPITELFDDVSPMPTSETGSNGQLVEFGLLKTLTIPVFFSVTYDVNFLRITTTYSGTIVASVPEPSSLLLCAAFGACVFGRGVRRRR